jgi:peptidoglycan/LPS O-acetylase OafA/YrhL
MSVCTHPGTLPCPRDSGERLVALDGLRGVAALVMVLFHANPDGSAGPFSRGYLMVDVFFVLSGYVLALRFEPKLASGLDPLDFLRARYRRFLPMAMLGAALGAISVIGVADDKEIAAATVYAMFLVPMLGGTVLFLFNAPLWSLLVELAANAAHAFALRRLPTGALMATCAVAGTALAIVVRARGDADGGAMTADLGLALLRVGFGYTLGMIMARERSAFPGRAGITAWLGALAAPVAIVVALVFLPLPRWIGDMLAIAVLLPACVRAASTARVSRAATPWLAALGAISFPLYAIHWPVLELTYRLLPGSVPLFWALPLPVAAAWAVHLAMTRWQRRRTTGLLPATAAATPAA